MAEIEFWGGVGVVGSSKVLIRDGGHRVLLDLGLDIPRDGDLLRAPAAPRPGRELADRLALGAAPRLPGVFAPSALAPGDPLGEPVGPTALFVTHPHIDHIGLAGFVRDDVPVHASPQAARLMRSLAAAGEGLPGGDPHWIELPDAAEDRAADRATPPSSGPIPGGPVVPKTPVGSVVTVGPIEVERIPVDHDVPGASGYLVRTSDGTLAFTGDFRFHGRHGELSWRFAERVAGCDVLVTEGTTLGWEEYQPLRTEEHVDRDFAALLDGAPDLLLSAIYPRDVDRVVQFTAIAAAAGRTIVWPDRTAAFLAGMGLPAPVSIGALGLDDLRAAPGSYVVQFDPDRIVDLLDLPLGPATVFIHANGEPLGPFEPRWQLFADWMAKLGIPIKRIGASGHAYKDDLHRMIHQIGPKVLIPIHTTNPYRLHPVGPTTRLVVDYAQAYDFSGRAI